MPNVDQYAVIGNPIAHSKSPYLHMAFGKQCQQTLNYQALLAPLDQFETIVQQFAQSGGRGASVTLPFKLEAYQLCDQVSPRARAAQAVNTLSFGPQGIVGDNTDGIGLVTDILNNAGVTIEHSRILLLGAGGAARGVILPILDCQPSELVIANRSTQKAQQLVKQFCSFGPISSVAFADIRNQFDIIINATSASLATQALPIPDQVYHPSSLAYDMMYANQPSLFMQHAAQCGAQTRNGWGMLVEQAAEAFQIWRGVRPDTRPFFA